MKPVTPTFNCQDEVERSEGLAAAQTALSSKQCVVIPTDTVYGIAADAFSPQAVATLLAAKGRSRKMPPPVLIPRPQTMDGLAVDVSADARLLADTFWPGGLTLIFRAQPSLTWDLGETKGTVALRMPDDRIALDLLALTGPLAVSSANRTGRPAAQTAVEAFAQLGESVEVYLEAGEREAGSVPSTIVDCTSTPLRVVREGALSLERLREAVPGILGLGEELPQQAPEEASVDAPEPVQPRSEAAGVDAREPVQPRSEAADDDESAPQPREGTVGA